MAAPARYLSVSRRLRPKTGADARADESVAQRKRALSSIDLFSPLTEDELHELAGRMSPQTYVEGSLLARQGETGDQLYLIVSGRVVVWLESRGGRQRLAELGPGDIVGEMSLMTGEPRRATLTASGSLVTYVLAKSDFQDILEQRPELAEAFAQLLAQRNKELTEARDNAPGNRTQHDETAILAHIRRLFRL